MKCLILAAGYATRLYPLTENFPKPLLTVGDKTILDWLIEDIDRSGMIDEYIVISNGKFAEHFEKWAPERVRVVNDNTFTNETRLGAVKDIKFALDTLGIDDEIMVIAGDNLLDFSLCSFLEYYKEKKASSVMRFYEADENKLLKCGVVTVDENDRITEMTEKSPTPATHWVCPPFYIYTREDAARIGEALEDGCGYDAPGSLVSWLCKKSAVYAMEMPGKRYDIGNLESYEKVKAEYKGIK
ncbi:MAG: nucleotidyltransferase family protein [Clostridia bacterium]|nr:nucleotidyltransferase family protein [Clostridia bacterium]